MIYTYKTVFIAIFVHTFVCVCVSSVYILLEKL